MKNIAFLFMVIFLSIIFSCNKYDKATEEREKNNEQKIIEICNKHGVDRNDFTWDRIDNEINEEGWMHFEKMVLNRKKWLNSQGFKSKYDEISLRYQDIFLSKTEDLSIDKKREILSNLGYAKGKDLKYLLKVVKQNNNYFNEEDILYLENLVQADQ